MKTKLDLNDMYLFHVVANTKNITFASKELGTTKQSLSRKLVQLEADFGVTLFARNTRSFELTAAGQEFSTYCGAVVEKCRSAEARIRAIQESGIGLLKVHMPDVFQCTKISELVKEFLWTYPDQRINVVADPDRGDLIAHQIDVQFKLGELAGCSLIARPLGGMQFVHVVSPSALSTSQNTQDEYFVRVENFNYGEINYAGKTSASNVVLPSWCSCKSLILAGYGHGVLPYSLCHQELERGTLTKVSDQNLRQLPVSLVFLRNKFIPRNVRTFIDFMVEKSRIRTGVVSEFMA